MSDHTDPLSLAAVAPVTVTYRFQLGGEGRVDEVPCDLRAIERALCRPGGGGWSWCLDPISEEQAAALHAYETEMGERAIKLPTMGPMIVEIEAAVAGARRAASEAGRAWAEREAEAAERVEGPWLATEIDALPLVEGEKERRRELAGIVHRAACSRWQELAGEGDVSEKSARDR